MILQWLCCWFMLPDIQHDIVPTTLGVNNGYTIDLSCHTLEHIMFMSFAPANRHTTVCCPCHPRRAYHGYVVGFGYPTYNRMLSLPSWEHTMATSLVFATQHTIECFHVTSRSKHTMAMLLVLATLHTKGCCP